MDSYWTLASDGGEDEPCLSQILIYAAHDRASNWAIHLPPKDGHRLQGVHRLSPNPNIYNNLGNLLFARQQPRHSQQMGF
jgi:hypothetical protein